MASADRPDPDTLKGTTLKVYRYLFKLGKPAGVRDIQRALGLGSSSVAEYHVKKLLQGGLIKEGQEGYTVDRNIWQNMVRMRKTVIPFQAFFVVLFAGAVIVMLTALRTNPAEGYLFGLAVVLVSLAFHYTRPSGRCGNPPSRMYRECWRWHSLPESTLISVSQNTHIV